MPRFDAYFEKSRAFVEPGDPPGRMWGDIGFVRRPNLVLEVKFLLDTGSSSILLMDADFYAALVLLGCPRTMDRALIERWIADQDQLLEPSPPIKCPAGEAGPRWHLVDAYLWLVHNHSGMQNWRKTSPVVIFLPRSTPPVRRVFEPVYGLFTKKFFKSNGKYSFPSLLGRTVLNQIQALFWNGPGDWVTLSDI